MPESLRFGRVEVRPAERALLIDGKPVELGSRAFDLLLALISHRDHVMTKDELLDMVWPGVVVEENNLQVQVSALRKALGPQVIATVPGRGYQFVAADQAHASPMPTASDVIAPAVAQPDTVASTAAKSSEVRHDTGRVAMLFTTLQQHKGILTAIVGSMVVLAGVAAFWNATHSAKVDLKSPQVVATAPNAPALSIVVLPFANLTGDANQAYVADGLTASLTADLSRIRDAFIVDAATAFTYKDNPATAQQVGRDLGVRFVLQGSVQRSGTVIRINAQLADAASNAQLWSDTFEGDQSDLFALQDKVTARIGNSIGQEMVIVAGRESETRKYSPKAADLILRARAVALKPMSLKRNQQGEALYREALALEPDNPRAMIGLAMSLAAQAGNFGGSFDESVREKKFAEARDLALKVKELDPDDPSVYMVMGTYASGHDDFDGSRRARATHVLLAPKDPSAYNNLALSYFYGGEPKRAIELLTQAVNLNPRRPADVALSNLCRAHFMLGDNDSAIPWCLRALEINPKNAMTYAYLAMAYSVKGDDTKASATMSDLRRQDPEFAKSGLVPADQVERPRSWSTTPAAFKEWREKKLLPAARKVGLVK